ncbi:MAG: hypothetical protein COB02_10330 [Candidatus Cloacimonadota bacterium]|nr:MAG: hypothetical protein COB02_10330 [Candidatus Cloacimonadota bacterium]
MKLFFIISLLNFNLLFAQNNTLSKELQIIFLNAVSSLKTKDRNFNKILKQTSRLNRKEICLKLMTDYKITDPKTAYMGANCLLFNGYGDLSIPFFVNFSINGDNKKYLNGRMGYGWLHAGDWYNVGPKVFTKMTQGKDLFTWVQKQMQDEVLNHPKKYDSRVIVQTLKSILREKSRSHPLSEEDEKIIKTCQDIRINLKNYQCKFNRKSKDLTDCTISKSINKKLVECKVK